MSDHKRVFLLILIMTAVSGAIGIAAVGVLYRAAFDEEQQRLIEIAKSHARLIEAIARFDETYSRDYPQGPREATLSQIRNAHAVYEGFGETGEFTLAERQADHIQFILSFRHPGPGAPKRISLQSNLAEPMRRALAGRSGTLVGLDYRGAKVLAAHEPVAMLDLGIVAKIDLAEIRAPFLRAGSIVGGTALLLIAAGILLFFRVSKPILQRIADSEERFRSISTTAQDAIIMMDSEGKVSFWNTAAERIFGYKGSEARGQALADMIVPERYKKRHLAGAEDFLRTGQGLFVNKTVDLEAERKDGTELPVEISVSGVRLGENWNAVGIIRDITQRKKAEQKAQEKQDLLEQIIENIPHSIFWKDRNSIYLGCNRNFARQAGVEKPEKIIGKTDYDLAWKETEAEFFRRIDDEVMKSGQPQLGIEEPQLQADGTQATLLTSKVPLSNSQGDVIGILGIYADITNRKRAEQELRASEEQLKLILASTGEGIFGMDRMGQCTFTNRASVDLLRYQDEKDLLGQDMHTLIHHTRPDGTPHLKENCPIYQARCEGKVVHLDDELLWRADGSSFPVDYRSHPMFSDGEVVGTVNSFTDITERKEKEAQLLQAQKMELVGQLTGGIAHDFNNLLTVILANLGLLSDEIGSDAGAKSRELINDALSAARDGAALTHRLLAFSRKQPLQVKRVDVNDFLRNIRRFLQRTLRKDIELIINPANEVPPVLVDPSQFESALLNLVVNAGDAMPEGGTLTIETTRKCIEADEPTADPKLAPGNYVMITVRDSGIGMSPEDAARAIEPFFTTKPHGKGSGLGLSMVYGFAKQSGGSLLLRSVLGEGTSVSMLLREATQTINKDDAKRTPRNSPGGSEAILLVEDDLQIRNVAKRILLGLGYRVTEVEDAAAAMKVFETEAAVNLLFSDIVIPGDMNGRELAHCVSRTYRGLKVLLTTGRSEELTAELPVKNGGFHLLKKPYTKDELASAVRAVLDGA